MSETDRPVQINISGIPVAGVGGLGLVAMAALVSYVMPAAWWTMVAGVLGGCVLATVLVFARRRLDKREPGAPSPAVLFVDTGSRASSVSNTDVPARPRAKRASLVSARQAA